jgi:hypothetical protein
MMKPLAVFLLMLVAGGTAWAEQDTSPEFQAWAETLKRSGFEIDVTDAQVEQGILTPQPDLSAWEGVRRKALRPPTDLDRTSLRNATFEGVHDAAPQGYGAYTRVYRLGKQIVELEELDFTAMGNSPPPPDHRLDLMNVTVAGRPAMLVVKKSPRYRLSELTWFTAGGEKLYILRTTLPRGQVLKLAEEITAAGSESGGR